MSCFDEYYDDEYYEPSKIEQAYQEFLEKAKECVKEDLAQQIKKVKEDKNYVYNKDEELTVKERELNQRELEINKKYDNLDKYKEDIVLDWLTQNGLDLTPGQKVYVIDNKYIKHTCPNCNGSGKISVKDINNKNYEMRCPNCNSGNIEEIRYLVKEMYVCNVSINVEISKTTDWKKSTQLFVRGGFRNPYSSWDYYGVELSTAPDNSGSSRYNRQSIYLTKEECQKAADKKQKKRRKE